MAQGGDIRQRWQLDGGPEVIAQLRAIGNAGERAAADLRSATGRASVALGVLGDKTAAVGSVFRELSFLAGGAAGPLARIVTSFGALATGAGGVGLAVAGVVGGLAALAKMGANAADEIRDGAIRIGTSAESYSTLKFALEQSGAGAEGFEAAMGRVLDASNKADEAGAKTEQGAGKIDEAVKKLAASNAAIGDLFRKKNQDLADEQSRSADEIAELTRRKGTAEEEAQFASGKRIADIQRNATRELNEIIRKRNQENQRSLEEFNAKLVESAEKAARGTDAFSKLGVALKDSSGNVRDTTEIFKDIAGEVAKIPDAATRAAKGIELFSRRAGPRLAESLSLGRKGIEALEAEAAGLGLRFSREQVAIGDSFNDAIAKLSGTIAATSGKVGLLFAPAFTAITEAMAAAFGAMQGPILDALRPIAADLANLFTGNLGAVQSQFLLGMRDAAVAAGAAFKVMGTIVGNVLTTLGAGFKFIAETINSVFGTKFTAVDIPLFIIAIKAGAVAIGVLTAAFVALRVATLANPVVAIATAVVLLGAVIVQNWGPITQFFDDVAARLATFGQSLANLGAAIAQPFAEAWATITAAWAETVKLLSDGVENVKTFFNDATKQIGDAWAAAGAFIKNTFIDPVLGFLQAVIDKATAVASAVSAAVGGAGAASTDIPERAQGGSIYGRGTGTSDSILAWVSNGEYIIREAVARKLRPFLDVINSTGRIPGFAAGGLAMAGGLGGLGGRQIMPPSRHGPRMARSNALSRGRPITLVIGDRTIAGLDASPDAVREIISYARQQSFRSLGTKPGWFGG